MIENGELIINFLSDKDDWKQGIDNEILKLIVNFLNFIQRS